MARLQIIYQSPHALYPNPDNARTHPAKQVSKLARSLTKFGFNVPVQVDPQNMILCGHGRVLAAIEAQLDEIPTNCIAHLNEAQRRAFVLADNRLYEGGGWNETRLAIELQTILELEDSSFEIVDTGFEIGEADYLIGKLHKPEIPNEPELPVDPDRVCRPGDLWLMGSHLLFCGDALDPLSYRILLGERRADMIITDPPYNIEIAGKVSGLGKVKHGNFMMASGEMSREQFRDFLARSLKCMADVSRDGAIHFVFMDWRQIDLLIEAGRSVYSELKNICVWDKGSGSMGGIYRSRHELVAVFKSGAGPVTDNVRLGAHGRNRTNVWNYPGMSGFGRDRAEKLAWHPTVKNLEMVADAMLDCSDPGSLILDPFAGSGTCALAAERCGRTAALIELDPTYCDVILRRFCDATGIEPVNAWTGEVVSRKPIAPEETGDVG